MSFVAFYGVIIITVSVLIWLFQIEKPVFCHMTRLSSPLKLSGLDQFIRSDPGERFHGKLMFSSYLENSFKLSATKWMKSFFSQKVTHNCGYDLNASAANVLEGTLVNLHSTVCSFKWTLCPWKSVIVQGRYGASVCKHFLWEVSPVYNTISHIAL